MTLFLLAKILGGIGLLLIVINILFFIARKDKGTKNVIYVIFFITLFVNITIWVVSAAVQ